MAIIIVICFIATTLHMIEIVINLLSINTMDTMD